MPYMTEKPSYRAWYFGGSERLRELRERAITKLTLNQRELLKGWLRIALQQPTLARAYHPPVYEASIKFYDDHHNLATELIALENPPIGTGLAIEDLCLFYRGLPAVGGDWLPIMRREVKPPFVARLPSESVPESVARVSRLVTRHLAGLSTV